jgi:hypothetical protein
MFTQFKVFWPRLAIVLCTIGTMAIATAIPAASQNQIAQVKTVSGQVKVARGGGGQTSPKAGDPLFEKDTIVTGANGSIGITFIDNTVMSAGPNSEISLEQFTFDSSNFNGSMLTELRKGTLSVVSGDIARSSPGAMKVRTPAATLGVRGTRFVAEATGDQ